MFVIWNQLIRLLILIVLLISLFLIFRHKKTGNHRHSPSADYLFLIGNIDDILHMHPVHFRPAPDVQIHQRQLFALNNAFRFICTDRDMQRPFLSVRENGTEGRVLAVSFYGVCVPEVIYSVTFSKSSR